MRAYDLVIIGGGPGGYVAAIRASQLGLRVACVEGRGQLGGTCLNVGAMHGVSVENITLNLTGMLARKDKIVGDLTKGIEFLFKKNDVTYIRGWGRIPATGVVEAVVDGKTQTLTTKNILIATGSEPTPLPGVEIDEKTIVSSTGALAFQSVPEKLVVIGAGVIGLELGQVWSRLGAKVRVVEYCDRILPEMDGEISKLAQRALSKRGLNFSLGRRVLSADTSGAGATLKLERIGKDTIEELDADAVLVAIGRRPVVRGLGLDALGIALNERGFIEVDEKFKTAANGIYAIGDCVPGPMLAHKAEEDGVACVEGLAGKKGHVDYATVPSVVYTHPEIASVGKTEGDLKQAGIDYSVGRFAFMANSRARSISETDGIVKILAEAETGHILGAFIVGAHGGDLIAELVLAMTKGTTIEDVARASHAHPAMGEAVKEACLDALGRAIHT